jgi:hypothetical protein
MSSVKQLSPYVRIVRMGTGMEPGHNLEIHEKVGNDWKKHWGTNEMSNDMAATELEKKSDALVRKHENANAKKSPGVDFDKERKAHGYLSSDARQELIKSGKYQGYMKKGGKVSTHKPSTKSPSW